MKPTRLFSLLTVVFIALITTSAGTAIASELPPPHRSKRDKDITRIGHRHIARKPNLFPLQTELQLAATLSAKLDHSLRILNDPLTVNYVEDLALKIAANSDANLPMTIRVVDTDDVTASTLLGGYQYISRGLLLAVSDECELASLLARGVAHTALHSVARVMSHAQMVQMASAPLGSALRVPIDASALNMPLMLIPIQRENEFDADYFGIQYLYKSGYDPECFIQAVRRVWGVPPVPPGKIATAFSPIAPPAQRVKLLREEIERILPKRTGEITSTPEFDRMQQHLRVLPALSPPATAATPAN